MVIDGEKVIKLRGELAAALASADGGLLIDGDKVKKLRESLGLSQTELARRADISQAIVAAIEAGLQRTSRAVPRIADALNVPSSELDAHTHGGDGSHAPAHQTIHTESAATAFEAMLSHLRHDLSAENRQALATIFLAVAREPPDETIDLPLFDQMRLRAHLLVRPFLKG
jgi:transcriptional regulator with XRE-family HTH domain